MSPSPINLWLPIVAFALAANASGVNSPEVFSSGHPGSYAELFQETEEFQAGRLLPALEVEGYTECPVNLDPATKLSQVSVRLVGINATIATYEVESSLCVRMTSPFDERLKVYDWHVLYSAAMKYQWTEVDFANERIIQDARRDKAQRSHYGATLQEIEEWCTQNGPIVTVSREPAWLDKTVLLPEQHASKKRSAEPAQWEKHAACLAAWEDAHK